VQHEDFIKNIHRKLLKFQDFFEGDIFIDDTMRSLYASDASLYREWPMAVLYPKSNLDLKNCIIFCNNNNTSMIPRTAGTSLAGQCVGEGIVVDVSRYLNQIIELNVDQKWVIVQPGVVRDELNQYLKNYGLFFGPNTSTSNRAMIGGMLGNNSSGSYSITYGTTRDHVIEVSGFLSDGSDVSFGPITSADFRKKAHGTSLESAVYRHIAFELNHPITQNEIIKEFPKSSVTRRNTGYALDSLLKTEAFGLSDELFNFSKLMAGSEGTLMLFSSIKLNLVELPSPHSALICAHFDTLNDALTASVSVMELKPRQCELMDKTILDCTKENIQQNKNRFFIQGDPKALLMIEVSGDHPKELDEKLSLMQEKLQSLNSVYASPVLFGSDIARALHLRASGLGVLQNIKGDERPLEFVEDTAVAVADLPQYIAEFDSMMSDLGTSSVYYAHAGAGELHIRPKVNLRNEEGRKKFRTIATQSAQLVKKYNGSLSGEHGDGRVRSEFIPLVVGQRNYELFKRIKYTWDPKNIFNPGKIVDAKPMDQDLREAHDGIYRTIDTILDFGQEGSFMEAALKCSGSGDCRKSEKIGGVLCPSYQASREEKYTTRARANLLRELMMSGTFEEKVDQKEVYDILSMCLGCKACISECPSSVDMASMKSEFLYQYHKKRKATFGERNMAFFFERSPFAQKFSLVVNTLFKMPIVSSMIKKSMGIDPRRSMPMYSNRSVEAFYRSLKSVRGGNKGKVYLYCDEFTNYLDTSVGIKTIGLLSKLGYEVELLPMMNSARSLISKGFLEEAKIEVNKNIRLLEPFLSDQNPIVGIEPSCILGFRDDYKRLVHSDQKELLEKLNKKIRLIEEFLSFEMSLGKIEKDRFESRQVEIMYHGHCHQKSLSSSSFAMDILSFPKNYSVVEIPSGCCGMAGSFGYEHYDMSMNIGELVLFPEIRKKDQNTIVAASGTSCRHQIKDGTSQKAFHPVEILFDALK